MGGNWKQLRGCSAVQLSVSPFVCLTNMDAYASSLSQFTKSLSAKFVDILMSRPKNAKTTTGSHKAGRKEGEWDCRVALTSVTVVP